MAAGIAVARHGWGISRVLSYQIGPDLESKQLMTVLDRYAPASLPIHLIHIEGCRAAAKVRGIIDLAANCLRRSPILN